jgi:hypothetical protein
MLNPLLVSDQECPYASILLLQLILSALSRDSASVF